MKYLAYCFGSYDMYMRPENFISFHEMNTLCKKTSSQALEQCLSWIFDIKTNPH